MKITVETKVFSNAVKPLKALVNQKATMPSLLNIHFKGENGVLSLITSDLECTMRIDVPYVSDDQGRWEFLANAELLNNMLATIKDSSISLVITDDLSSCTIITNKGKFNFPCENADSYIQANFEIEGKGIEVNSKAFTSAIKKSQKFQSVDTSRPQMQGTFVSAKESSITIYATDAHRMYKGVVKTESVQEEEITAIIPQKATTLLQGLIGDDNITIKISDKNILMKNANTSFLFQMVEGNYPKCESIIPKNKDYKLIISKEELNDNIKQVQIFADKSNGCVKIENTEKGMIMSANDSETQKTAKVLVDKRNIKENTLPTDFVIGFKAPFLLDCINTPNDDNVSVYFNTPQKPILIFNEDNEEEETILLMPIMVN